MQNLSKTFCKRLQKFASPKYYQDEFNLVEWLLGDSHVKSRWKNIIPIPDDDTFQFLFVHCDGRDRSVAIINYIGRYLEECENKDSLENFSEKLNQIEMSWWDQILIRRHKLLEKKRDMEAEHLSVFQNWFPIWKQLFDKATSEFQEKFLLGRIHWFLCHNQEVNIHFRFPGIVVKYNNHTIDTRVQKCLKELDWVKYNWKNYLSTEESDQYFTLPFLNDLNNYAIIPFIKNRDDLEKKKKMFTNSNLSKFDRSTFSSVSYQINLNHNHNLLRKQLFWTQHIDEILFGDNNQKLANNLWTPCANYCGPISAASFGQFRDNVEIIGNNSLRSQIILHFDQTHLYFSEESVESNFFQFLSRYITRSLLLIIQHYADFHSLPNSNAVLEFI